MTNKNSNFKISKLVRRDGAIPIFMFLFGIAMIAGGISIYQTTIIPASVLVVVTLTSGIFGSLITLFFVRGEKIWYLFSASFIFFGGGAYFLLLFCNEQLATTETITDDFPIVHVSDIYGKSCRPVVIDIDYYGLPKELVFSCQDEKAAARAKSVRITYSDGFFRYPVIRAKQII